MRYAAIGAALALSLLGSVAVAQPQPDKPPASAEAQAIAQADVLVLHATNSGKGIDKKIRELPYQLPQLEKPPLSAYDSYELLDHQHLALGKSQARVLKLPAKRVLKVKIKDIIAPKKPDETSKYVVQASITKAGGKTVLRNLEVRATPKVFFFVAGPTYKQGILVIGMRVVPK